MHSRLYTWLDYCKFTVDYIVSMMFPYLAQKVAYFIIKLYININFALIDVKISEI